MVIFNQPFLSGGFPSFNRTPTYTSGLGSAADGTNASEAETSTEPTKSVTGKIGSYCWDWAGDAQRYDFTRTGGATGANAFSISVWAMIDTLPSSLGHDAVIVALGGAGTTRTAIELVVTSADDKFGIFHLGDDHTGLGSALSTGTWYHFGYTYDGSTTAKAYFNGSQVGATKTLGGTLNINTASRVADSKRTYNNEWGGKTDQLIIWDTELTSGNMSTLYNSGTGQSSLSNIPSVGNIEVHFNFEQTGTTLTNQAIP